VHWRDWKAEGLIIERTIRSVMMPSLDFTPGCGVVKRFVLGRTRAKARDYIEDETFVSACSRGL
jgi:hypothetical protein